MTEKIISQTKKWILDVVIGCNFCPFAQKEFKNDTIKYVIDETEKQADQMASLLNELHFLQLNESTETTLIIYPTQYQSFEKFLKLIDDANDFVEENGFYGVFQLATFHPNYCFEGEHPDDASNFTNRSIYPMLHILRESSILKVALKQEAYLESIPTRNITYALAKGSAYMQMLKDACE
jgi:uncharacterized protein